MGKKLERGFAKDKDKSSTASHDNQEDDPNKTPGKTIKSFQIDEKK